ncbi:hypothetical protein SAMN05421786_104113 [Chryseobacterium ureilyticum]|uniref:Uncharacterized protein n=1 Tax=Chryseobacterium ureilyticum TaxID=373668 RepID=A0A1N7NVT6_9FLAO|nr:hypothetical protein [Chryseobacterium ureilyticum]SIT02505.1 hypothetical protein SAMN05421786_104113 [Chryseobacterium ureilyticum]
MTARDFIASEINKLNDLISKNIDKESNLNLKKELSETLYLINIFDEYQINKKTIDTIIELPSSNTGYSDYRIINDCESDDPDHWLEVSINEEKIRLAEGDIVIRKK